ncbi:MAG: TatD family hydrolase [Gammaproteobacteria bacterium]|nr:TatD family hydrolase [Gammaproteobacteria bacterium]
MSLFDSHCHLDFAEFDDDRDALWAQCRAAGIERLLIPGVCLADFQRQAAVVASCSGTVAAYGLHPWWQQHHRADHLQLLANWLSRSECVAVGECGLDLAIDGADLALQRQLLNAQLALAVDFNKPVVLHVRSAHEPLLNLLKAFRLPKGGVVHAFSGPPELAAQYARHGLKLGIGGTISYLRAAKTRRTVAEVPLDWLVLETDAPAMPLAGYQGQRNSPLQLPLVLTTLAALRDEQPLALADQLWRTSCELFG